jgi:hypothetical protein
MHDDQILTDLGLNKGQLLKDGSALSVRQVRQRIQRYTESKWPWLDQQNTPDEFNAWKLANQTNVGAALQFMVFNQQLADYRAAVTRLERCKIADGQAEITEEQETGKIDPETVVIQQFVEALDATIEVDTYDPETGESTGTETVTNPLIVTDEVERGAASAVIFNTPDAVKTFGD